MLDYYVIYAKSDCGWCARAIEALNESGVDYVLTLLDKAPDFHEDLKNHYEHVTMPLVLKYSKIQSGDAVFIGGHDDLISHLKEIGLC